jgi:hypothetical protein
MGGCCTALTLPSASNTKGRGGLKLEVERAEVAVVGVAPPPAWPPNRRGCAVGVAAEAGGP